MKDALHLLLSQPDSLFFHQLLDKLFAPDRASAPTPEDIDAMGETLPPPQSAMELASLREAVSAVFRVHGAFELMLPSYRPSY